MTVYEKAFAKINISLDVTGKRPDGYHDMVMPMQTLSLCDELTLRLEGEGIRARSNLRYVPSDDRNLAVRAAKRYLSEIGKPDQGLQIELRKKIPVGSGMGGGSADAAAVLRALNRAYGEALSREQLTALAGEIGSDVAFCLIGGTMLATGRGEVLSPLPPLPPCRIVIVKPGFSISTPELFQKLDRGPIRCHPDTDGLIEAMRQGDLSGVCRRLYNVFEDVDDRRMRTIRQIKGSLLDGGALGAVMTGTGSAVFGLFADDAAAESCCGRMKKEYGFACTAEAVGELL
ncbi:MAG: 4-(cytidine 5'-diphospho)-2-C-methyl-D-erythritol kinase [Oscillospiraceae bacterium]|nr:4-(cytidine 5'-diphospho)-2-C-methyl-D-erythritol kinase [Oscillospiraceae bacterium]